MLRKVPSAALCGSVLLALVASAWATENKKLTFSKPTNTSDSTVTVIFDPGKDVSVTIPADSSAEQKRNLIKEALENNGYDVTTQDDNGNELPGNQLRILYLRNGTKVAFGPGNTGELRDDVLSTAAVQGSTVFAGLFDPFDYTGQPAMFTAGIVTDVGELTVQVSAEELSFPDGPIICQALFQRLAPHAPVYGAQINYAGDRLEIYFDPAYTVEQGGVSFGTTSPSAGCSGSVLGAGSGCVEDIDGDGVVGLSDLSILLAAYGTGEQDPGYHQAADLDGSGTIDLADLSMLLAAYGSQCH